MILKNTTNTTVEIEAPAKINLFLEVLNKREDGFHNVNSVFQAVSLYDRLFFEASPGRGIDLKVINDSELSTGKDNLIVRTFELVSREFGLRHGLSVELEKNIPIAAGLAGGSSDAAATILACNHIFHLGLGKAEMAQLGAQIGSDLPFFFSGGQAIVTGRGEIVTSIQIPTEYYLVLVKPDFPVSTAEAYARLKRGLTFPKNPFKLARCATVVELLEDLHNCGNDFEAIHLGSFPELEKIRGELLNCGAKLARMSGSGPTMFGVFESAPDTFELRKRFSGNWSFFVVRPITFTRDGST